MKFAVALRMVWWMALLASSISTRADSWNYWSTVPTPFPPTGGPAFAKLATDGTNIYYATLLDGVYRASLEDGVFTPMPMTGFPLWSLENTNGFALWNLGVSRQGTVVISGSPINITTNNISPPPGYSTNTLPLFYFWDETANQRQTATVTNKTYPYTSSAGNFSVAPDGALWTCSGFASYAYRSTNGGRSYTAFDINARVPTNYIPFINGQTTFGKVFSIVATPKNEIIVGTETGGYLHSTNNGQTWTSLDPNFTSTNSLNPLGHIGNAMVIGYDRYANVLCQNGEFSSPFAGATNWINIKLIEYRPSDGSYFKADNNIPSPLFPPQILTTISGDSFTFMNQNWLLEGGIYRSSDGRHWTQFNEGIPALTLPFAPGITNAVAPGNCMTAAGTVLFVGTGTGQIYRFDSTPPPITNHPPIALPQCLNVTGGASTNFILSASDADNDPLTFSITTPPQHGFLTGTPPDLTYTPTNGFIGLDGFYFDVSDEMATSPPVIVNIAVNFATNPIPQILLSIPNTRACVIAPTNITLVAVATDSDGIRRVDFDVETGRIASITNPPYTFVWTNPPAGTYTLAARAVDNLGARAWSAPLTISVLPLPLQTTIQTGSSNLFFVSWPLVFNNALLEFSTNVNGPWALVSTAPLDRNYSEHVVTLTNDLPAQFFRLFATP